MNLYLILIRARLGYGAVVYQSTTPSTLKMLDAIHHQDIHLAAGAFRISPVERPYVEANERSLHLQRSYLSFTNFLKVNANTEHSSYTTVNDLVYATLFHNRLTAREPFSLRVRKLSEQMGFPILEPKLMTPAKPVPPWHWQLIECDTSLVVVTKHAPEAHIKTHF